VTERSIHDLIDAVDDVLATTLSLARDISEADAGLPTECPGWTVRDQLAHIVGLEQVLGGAPQPTVELPPLDHVSSDIDEFMERQVHVRRGLPLCAIADELAGLRPRRIAELRRLAADGDPMVIGPFGERALSASLPIRVFDLWAHEQDIRRAVGLPVRISCAAAEIALERCLAGWSAALPRTVDLDAELVVHVTAPRPRDERILLGAGGTTVTLTGDLGEITRWFCGRNVPAPGAITGDAAAVALLGGHLGLTP
jgi:uncharacterized protein (TIGR03083 family)